LAESLLALSCDSTHAAAQASMSDASVAPSGTTNSPCSTLASMGESLTCQSNSPPSSASFATPGAPEANRRTHSRFAASASSPDRFIHACIARSSSGENATRWHRLRIVGSRLSSLLVTRMMSVRSAGSSIVLSSAFCTGAFVGDRSSSSASSTMNTLPTAAEFRSEGANADGRRRWSSITSLGIVMSFLSRTFESSSNRASSLRTTCRSGCTPARMSLCTGLSGSGANSPESDEPDVGSSTTAANASAVVNFPRPLGPWKIQA
jgi:hypothetical protein